MEVVLSQVRRNQQSFNTIIFFRDVREVGVAVVLIPIWIVMGITLALPWTWYLAIPGILFVAGFMIVDRWRRKPATSSADESLIATTERSLDEVNHQIWLLRNVLWWYLLPLSLPCVPFLIHVVVKAPHGRWNAAVVAVQTAILFVIVGAFVYWLNQRAVRKDLEPRRRELQELLASLQGDATE
jgi:MFS family permease